jgi:hypothetical protein
VHLLLAVLLSPTDTVDQLSIACKRVYMLSVSFTSCADHKRSATAKARPEADIQHRRHHVFGPQRGFATQQIGLLGSIRHDRRYLLAPHPAACR